MSACTVQKALTATGGSRADGIVELAYTYGSFEVPVINQADGKQLATQRCAAWGYQSAEPFNAGERKCLQHNGLECIEAQVTIKYQCTGAAITQGYAPQMIYPAQGAYPQQYMLVPVQQGYIPQQMYPQTVYPQY